MSLVAERKEAPTKHNVSHLSDDAIYKQMKYLLIQMEDAVQHGESLTSENMIRLSQQLDTYVVVAQTRRMKHKDSSAMIAANDLGR